MCAKEQVELGAQTVFDVIHSGHGGVGEMVVVVVAAEAIACLLVEMVVVVVEVWRWREERKDCAGGSVVRAKQR